MRRPRITREELRTDIAKHGPQTTEWLCEWYGEDGDNRERYVRDACKRAGLVSVRVARGRPADGVGWWDPVRLWALSAEHVGEQYQPVPDQIRALMADGADRTSSEIGRAIGVTPGAALIRLNQMLAAGEMERVGRRGRSYVWQAAREGVAPAPGSADRWRVRCAPLSAGTVAAVVEEHGPQSTRWISDHLDVSQGAAKRGALADGLVSVRLRSSLTSGTRSVWAASPDDVPLEEISTADGVRLALALGGWWRVPQLSQRLGARPELVRERLARLARRGEAQRRRAERINGGQAYEWAVAA